MWTISSWDHRTRTGTIEGRHLGPLPFSAEGPFVVGEEVIPTLETQPSGPPTVVRVEPSKARQPPGTHREVFDEINSLELWEWRIGSFEGDTLTLWGSTDFSYYHRAEVEFQGVEFISCPACFEHALFRAASPEESEQVMGGRDWDESEAFAIVTEHGSGPDGPTYFVCAAKVSCRVGTVYYYAREDLRPGERIAAWVNRKGEA